MATIACIPGETKLNTPATPAPTPPQAGFNLSLAGLQTGNKINVTYTDTATNTQHALGSLQSEIGHQRVFAGID